MSYQITSRILPLALVALIDSSASAQTNPVPLVSEPLVPAAVLPGSGDFTLQVNGSGFTSGSVIKWNGCVRETRFVSHSQLTATILESDAAAPATASVTVFSPGPGGGTSNVVFLPITNPSAIELIESQVGTGAATSSVAAGDLNGDGKVDLVSTNYLDNTVSVLLSNGNGSFEPHVDYRVQGFPRSVTMGDFNSDGNLDLAVATQDGVVSILLGNGDGTFQTHQDFPTGILGIHVITADFNRDGKLDLAVADGFLFAPNIFLLFGNGDGTFRSPRGYDVGGYSYGSATGDFNGDGNLDLAVAVTGGHSIKILLGSGDGTFFPAGDYPMVSFPVSIITADFNGDNKLDLAIAVQQQDAQHPEENVVSILLGNGDGTFQSCGDYALSGFPIAIVTADLDGDGKLDLAITDVSDAGNDVSILIGHGDGTFERPQEHGATLYPYALATGDFNEDGRLDLVTTNPFCENVSLFLQAPAPSRVGER